VHVCGSFQFKGSAKSSYMAYNVWPPYVAAMIVGSLQLPLVLGLHKTLGGSTSMTIIVAQLFFGPFKRLSPYATKFRWGFEHCWQVWPFIVHIVSAHLFSLKPGSLVPSDTVRTVKEVSPHCRSSSFASEIYWRDYCRAKKHTVK